MSETDKKVEALAFKAASAHTSAGGSSLKELNEYGKRCWRAAVKALLEDIGCEDGVVPDVAAAVERLRACSIHSTRDLKDQCVEDAIRALTGGTDGE